MVEARRRTVRVLAGLAAVSLTLLGAVAPAQARTNGARRHAGPLPVAWTQFGFDLQRTGYNPDETVIGVGNASSLHPKWTYALPGSAITQPLYAPGVLVGAIPTDLILVGTEDGSFTAVNAATGVLVWTRALGTQDTDGCGGPYGIDGTAAVDMASNRVYVPGGTDRVWALDLSTGVTMTGWPVTISTNVLHEHLWGGLTLAGTSLYVSVASYCDVTPYYGRLVRVDTGSAKKTGIFWTTGHGSGVSGGGIWGMGGVAVDPVTRDVYVATGNAIWNPENFGYSEDVVRLSARLKTVKAFNYPGLQGGDVDFGATTMLYQPPGCPALLAVKNKDGVMFVYDRDSIGTGPIQSITMASASGIFQNLPAYSPVTNMVYVSDGEDSPAGTYFHGLIALSVQADCTLALAWQKAVGPTGDLPSPPTVANDVVYFADAGGARVFAFDAATGHKLWDSGTAFVGTLYGAPMVANGRLFEAGTDGRLVAFAP